MTEQQTQTLAALADGLAAAGLDGAALGPFLQQAGLLIRREAAKANVVKLRETKALAAAQAENAIQAAEAELAQVDAALAASVTE